MPTIAKFTEQNNPYPDSPTSADISPTRFGRDAAALANIGGQIGEIGSKLMQARKQAMDADAVADAQTADTLDFGKWEQEDRLSFEAGGSGTKPVADKNGEYKGMADTLHEKMSKRIEERMAAMPSGDAQRMYRSRMQPNVDSAYLQNTEWENKTRTNRLFEKVKDRNRLLSQDNFNAPTAQKTSAILKNLREDLSAHVGSTYSVDAADKEYKQLGRANVHEFFDGLARSEDGSGSAHGLRIVDSFKEGGASPYEDIRAVLEPGDLDNIRQKLDASHRQIIGQKIGEAQRSIDDTISIYKNAPPDQWDKLINKNSLQGKLGFLKNASSGGLKSPIQPDQFARLQAELAAAESTGRVKDQLLKATPEEMSNIRNIAEKDWQENLKRIGINDKGFAYGVHDKFNDIANQQQKAIVEAREKDGAGFVQQYFSAELVKDDSAFPSSTKISQRLAIQNRLGIQKTAILTDSERDSFKVGLDRDVETSSDKATQTIVGMKREFGQYAAQAFKEMKAEPYLITASEMDSPTAVRAVVDSFKNKEMLNAAYAKTGDADGKGLRAEVATALASQYGAMVAAGNDSNNIATAERHSGAVEQLAKSYIVNGADQESAIKRASDEIINQNFQSIGTALVPRQINGRPLDLRNIEGAMQEGYNPQWVRAQNIVIPKDLVDSVPGVSNAQFISDEMVKSGKVGIRGTTYRLDDAIKNGRWISDKDGLHARFQIKLANGDYAPLPVKTPSGQKQQYLRISYLKASSEPSPAALWNKKSTVQKITSTLMGVGDASATSK